MTSTIHRRVRRAATMAFFVTLVASAPAAMAATINIAWDANAPAENVVGYKVYIGTQAGVYGSPVDVGNVTTYAFTSAVAGQSYFFAVSAYDASGGNSPLSGEVSGSPAVSDATVPLVSVTSPTSASTYSTSANTISIGGTASDNVGVTQVTYTVNGGASVTASGTTSWSVASISLVSGTNTLVVTARDAAGNTSTDTLTVTYTPDTTVPAVAITSPTSAATFSTAASTVALGGTASDNIAVTQISYRVNGGASTNAAGTTSWSVASVALQIGSNTIVVTGRDAAGNSATDTLTVTRTDATAPTVTITTPTSAATFTTTATSINIGGTASDNVAVTQVTWSTNTGQSGAASGTTSWSVTGIPLQSGSNSITVTAADAAGNSSTDALTVTADIPGVVTADSATPNTGSGSSQTFVLKYSQSAGAGNLSQTWVWFNATLAQSAANSCMAYYNRPTNEVFILNDAATAWTSAVLGTSGTLQSSSCSIALASSVATANGNTLTLNLAVTFTSASAGGKNIYMYADDTAGSNSGWQDRGDWTVPAPPPLSSVTADSVTPNTGSGSSQTFMLKYSQSSGAGNLSHTWVWFSATLAQSAANSCMAYYSRPTNEIFILNDAATAWTSAVLGTSGTLQSSSCSIALASSVATANGNTLTLNLSVTFPLASAGAKNIYMYADDMAGNNSGWQTRGTWTVTSAAAAVTADSSTPNAGSGASQTFALTYSDTRGAANLTQVWMWLNTTLASSAANTCMAYYDKSTNQLNLINDSGTSWMSLPLGGGGTLQNSSCSIALGSTTASISGNTLTLNLAMTFAPAFGGTKNIYMYGADATLNSGWQTRGTWTVPSGVTAVTADSATPNAGSGSTQTFALGYSDTSGGVNLAQTWVWFNATFASSAANSCMAYYDKVTNQIYLINDAGTAWLPGTLGTGGTLQNASCAFALANSSISISGNTLTLTLATTFKPAFTGAKNIYMYGANATQNSGWQTRGTWTVP
jgi:hypothetical protein